MPMFTINADNALAFFPTVDAACADDDTAFMFPTFDALQVGTQDWPLSRFVAIHNEFAGSPPFGAIKPVKKFENRPAAVSRIWNAAKRLANGNINAPAPDPTPDEAIMLDVANRQASPMRAAQAANVAPPAAVASDTTTQEAAAPKGSKRAPKAKKEPKPAKAPKAKKEPKPKDDSKKATILAMLGRKKGASNEEIRDATGWQKHTVRGFLSILKSKSGLDIVATKGEDKVTRYRLA